MITNRGFTLNRQLPAIMEYGKMQQYNNQTILPSEINQDYFNAATDSINNFTSSENKMEKRIKLYNQFVSTKNKLISQTNHHYEPLSINKINYIAILT